MILFTIYSLISIPHTYPTPIVQSTLLRTELDQELMFSPMPSTKLGANRCSANIDRVNE